MLSHPSRGSCVATIIVPESWLNGGGITVQYGLNQSQMLTISETVTPQPYIAPEFENDFMAYVPARPMIPNQLFDVRIVVRATTDIESAKFTVVLWAPNQLAFHSSSPTGN